MDVHPSRELVASGQKAGRDRKSQAHVRIWSTESLQTLYVFGMGELDTGVTAVAFSQLVSVPTRDFHELSFGFFSRTEVATYWPWTADAKASCLSGSGSGVICWARWQ